MNLTVNFCWIVRTAALIHPGPNHPNSQSVTPNLNPNLHPNLNLNPNPTPPKGS